MWLGELFKKDAKNTSSAFKSGLIDNLFTLLKHEEAFLVKCE